MNNNQLDPISNLVRNHKIILNNLKTICGGIERISQIRKPKLASLNLTAGYTSINTRLQLFIYFKNTDLEFKIERSVYNKRHKKLLNYTI